MIPQSCFALCGFAVTRFSLSANMVDTNVECRSMLLSYCVQFVACLSINRRWAWSSGRHAVWPATDVWCDGCSRAASHFA